MPTKFTIDNAWKGKRPRPEEWLRDEESARKGHVWETEAQFDGVQMHEEGEALGRVACFYSNRNGKRFDIAERLAPKSLRVGEIVTLTVIGCCNIVHIQRHRGRKAHGKIQGKEKNEYWQYHREAPEKDDC